MRIATLRIETALAAAAGLGFLLLLIGALLVVRLDPLIVLALCAGAAILAMLFGNPVVGLHVLVGLFYFESALVTEEGFTAMRTVGPLIMGAWICNLIMRRSNPPRLGRFGAIMAAFILWGSLSLFYAEDFDAALTRLITFVLLATLSVMAISLMTDRMRIASIFWTIVVWSALAAVYGLYNYAAGAQYVNGPGENRNGFAMLMMVSLVVSFVLGDIAPRMWQRLLLRFGFLPLFAVALALTLSRGGYVSSVAACTVLLYRQAETRRFKPVIVLLMAIVLLSPFLPEAFFQRVQSIFPAVSDRSDTFGQRLSAWERGVQMVKAHPITGVGLGNFRTVMSDYSRGKELQKQIAAHSSYVGVAAEGGLVGLALFLALLFEAIRSANHAFHAARRLSRSDLQLEAVAVEAALVGVMVWSFSGNGETTKILWLLLALAYSLRRIVTGFEAEADRVPPSSEAAA